MSRNEEDPRALQGVRGTKTPDTGRRPTTTPRHMPLKPILKPSSSRESTNPTHHGVSRKVVPNGGNKHVTPSRAQPAQPSTSNNSGPFRIRKSSAGRPAVPSTSADSNRKPVKSYKPLTPLGQQLDNEYEEQLLSRKKDRTGNMAGFARRRTQIRRDANIGEDILRLNADDPQHVVAQISPILKLRIGRQAIDADEDEPRFRPQPKMANANVQNFGQRVLKAARKYQSAERSSSESDSSDSESDSSDSSSSSEGTVQHGEGSKSKPNSDSEDVMVDNVADDPPELVFDEEKMITAPLPDADKVEIPDGDIPQHGPQHGPTSNLVSAVKALSPSLMRLRATRHLPFLPRSLRKGFLKRCRDLLVPIYPLDKEIHLQVQYSIAGEGVHQVEVDKWMCPICDFFGEFPTKEMLECHLRWDHQEVYCEWEDLGLNKVQSWRLELLIQETEPDFMSPSFMSPPPPPRSAVQEKTPETSITPSSADIQKVKRPLTPEADNESSNLLFGSLSPSTIHPAPVGTDIDIKREEVEASLEVPQSSVTPTQGPTGAGSTAGSARRSLPLPGTFDPATPTPVPRTRPTTRTISPTSQSTPPPPPPENPLGPAAQPPYLPADYGGNLVLYSCRPGGPCLFDLLATLPMEPFGLLDWEVIDREDEIYESDDVKEEYKVMHALWARWIILNRPKFISNYAKGVIAFVDEYWKMIHWAAGWDALRYFLFIFLANNFLTGAEVAQTLIHYEGLTGMASWYD